MFTVKLTVNNVVVELGYKEIEDITYLLPDKTSNDIVTSLI